MSKKLGWKNLLVGKHFGCKKFGLNIFGVKNVGIKNFGVQKTCGVKNFGVKKGWCKKYTSQKCPFLAIMLSFRE